MGVQVAALALLLIVAAPFSARAEDSMFWKNGPCGGAVDAYCKDFELSPEDVLKCLEARREQMNADCRKELADISLDQEGVPEYCRSDVREVCPRVEAGNGRMMNCLKSRFRALSPGCRVALEEQAKLGSSHSP